MATPLPSFLRMRLIALFASLAGFALSADTAGSPQRVLPSPLPASSPFIQPESAPDPPPPKALPVTEQELRPAILEIPHVASQPSLVDAVLSGDEAFVTALLEAGVPPNGVGSDGDTPLCAALRNGRPDLALLLLFHGADPDAPGLEGHPPIALASLRRHPQLMRIILAAGADPNKAFATPHSKGLLEIVGDQYLRNMMKHQRNITPLMACAARGDVEAVTLLLQWGANKNKHSLPSYRYPINFAADQRYLYVMRILLGRDPEREPRVLITINLSMQKATLSVEGETKLQTAVSTGRKGYGTPAGRYVITNKYKHWISTIYDVPMPWFMRLNCGAIGLHSGYVTGRPASHGCIRLPHEMAKKFFSMTSVGDEVNIEY